MQQEREFVKLVSGVDNLESGEIGRLNWSERIVSPKCLKNFLMFFFFIRVSLIESETWIRLRM